MINTKFYDGFEGESELSLVSGINKLVIWNGYFEMILDSLIELGIEKKGIVKEYFYHEGWYDNSPWLISDLPLTIRQLKLVNADHFNSDRTSKEAIKNVLKELISFLELNSDQKVYIEYD
ncbi:hypothetical protein [Sporolactobacillus terrae]|uniref:Uncharacterized protein n=1 Tax=Sporolactobacillus terrae TaxID=269673 RepID=A0ABX5Q4M4_9BACL|nr:hypothetical protein [Sporolactobacillus terrae]QAA21596.1 hypothetical protein C0674_02595 [Sporolactobacillus terrae]QAA24568.1 hypothetical protein C0679_02575 [Sporolactobacillus terrae]UAK16407.1 hypothetical protein K7399_15925 [Sporolactobacillus terrae]